MRRPLISILLLLFASVLSGSFVDALNSAAASTNQPQQQLLPTYQSPKNVLFACTIGGSSHANWVLEILKNLESRGHSVTFATRYDHTRFGKKYGIETISIGAASIPKDTSTHSDNKHLDPITVMGTLIGHVVDSYPSEYTAFTELLEDKAIDLVICDHFVDSCIEAARSHNISFVITSTLAIAPDARASFISSGISMYGVHNNQITLYERIYHNYLFTLSFLWSNLDTLLKVGRTKEDLGLSSSSDTMATWSNSLKLVNTAFGLENARPLGPLVEFIGPILPQTYQSISGTVYETFLDNHPNVIYVAFGQNANPSLLDRKLIWSSLLSLLEENTIDGVIWVDGHFGDMPSDMDFVTLRQTTLTPPDVSSHTQVLLTDWAPQMAILQHPSTSAFLTHGGAGSIHESLYAAVPMAVFPFVGDQLGLARNIEEQGLGVYLNRDDTIKSTAESLRTLFVKDESRGFQRNVKRYSSLIQIHSQNGVQRGADLVEEVLFAGVSHRYEASRSMGFMKTYNLDIYCVFSLMIAGVLITTKFLYNQVRNCLAYRGSNGAKLKTQ